VSYIYFLIIIYPIIVLANIILSYKYNFVDKPNSRKVHYLPVSNTGGISLLIYSLLLIKFFEFSREIDTILAIGSSMILIGFFDDRKNLEPSVKLILMIFPILYLIFNGFTLNDLGSYEYIGLIRLGKFEILFSILAIGLLINAYNYVDGIDGLLLGLSITSLLYLYFLLDNIELKNFILMFIYPLVILIIFNFFPIKTKLKTFLGDSGSLFLGFVFSFMIIFMYKYEDIHPAYLIWFCWYPVFDFLSVTIHRVLNGKKFYSADKIHLHHLILKKYNFSHLKTTVIILIFNIIILSLGYIIANYFGKIYSLTAFIISFLFYYKIRSFLRKI